MCPIDDYNANSIELLSGLEGVRKRPECILAVQIVLVYTI